MVTLSHKITFEGRIIMKNDIIKIMMNPIRIKILQELGLKGKATTKEIQGACGDIAQATLYRHLTELLKNDIIQVIDENIINGIIEKVYSIKMNPTLEIAKDPTKLSRDDYSDIFSQFMISILTDFKSYISHEDAIAHIATSIGFSSNSIFLSDEELKEMTSEFRTSINKRLRNEPSPERKLRKISTIVTTTL